MKFLISFLSAVILLISGTSDNINKAIQSGDAFALKKYMNETVELVVLGEENVYSKTQAEQILKQFFSRNKPVKFEVLHNGGSDNSQYFIGSLKTERKTYRVYYLLKKKDGNDLLYQLRIEDDE